MEKLGNMLHYFSDSSGKPTWKMYGGGKGAMNPPQASQPRHVRYSVRYQARLDFETRAKLEELAAAFHRKRSAILRYVMQWGLAQTRGWTIDQSLPAIVQTVGMLLLIRAIIFMAPTACKPGNGAVSQPIEVKIFMSGSVV
jgi:hypothetical protein